MYGAVTLSDSPRVEGRLTVLLGDDGADATAGDSPLGSPVGVETAAAAARRRSANAFVPVVCSIFGVIIFMRLGMIVGVVGLWRAWGVILVAFSITFLSIGSLSALASSRKHTPSHPFSPPQDDEGFYDAVLGSVGEHAGRAIGVLLFLAFSVASAYYLLGFAEITVFYLGVNLKHRALPWNESGSWVTVSIASTMLALLTVARFAGGRVKKPLLVAVFVVVMISIGCSVLFLVVHNSLTATGFSKPFLAGNFQGHAPQLVFKMFGEFFPAFCGVLAGVHLADELIKKSSTTSLGPPTQGSAHLIVGAHKALAFSCFVYCLLSLALAACVENGNLRKQLFVVQLVVDSILGIPVIYLGIGATTLTSAFSNVMSAATVYDSIRLRSKDKSEVRRHLLDGRNTSSIRPRNSARGLVLAWALSQIAIACGSVDTIIPIVSSTFLFSFAVINFACFYHEIMSPTFSSSFIMYSKWSALLGFCMSVGALFPVMSTFFVGCMVAGMVGAFVFFQRVIPDFMGSIRRQDSQEIKTRRAVSSIAVTQSQSDATEGSGYSEAMLSRIDKGMRTEDDHDKRIEMAALYVRDALHGRFLGEEYVSEGLHKLKYKRWYHALQFARMGNMAVLIGLSFFEVPSWCFFSLQCGNPQHTLMWDLPTLPREVTLTIEMLNLAILGFESALKFQYLGKRLYFRNKWHIVQMVLLLSDAVSVILVVFVSQQNSASSDPNEQWQPIVPSPILRPLLLVTMSERLRSGFISLLRVLPRVMDGLFTILVLIVIYAISGMVMFEGSEEGRRYFPDFETAWMNMLILLTTANFPDVMMPAYQHARYTSIFFMSFLMIGLLLMMNLVFASIYQNYRQEISQRAMRFAQRRKQSLEFAFQLLPGDYRDAGEQHQEKVISRGTLEALIAELLRPVFSFFDAKSSTAEVTKEQARDSLDSRKSEINMAQFVSKIKGFAARQKLKSTKRPAIDRRRPSSRAMEVVVEFVRTKWFDYSVDVIILANLLAILFEIQAKIDQRVDVYMRLELFMPLFSCLYILEMALKMYANPWRSYFESMKNRYDCVVTIVIFVAEVSIQVHYTAGMNWQWIRILLLLRFLRCLRLLVALQSLSTMFTIVLQLLPTFTTLYGMLSIVMMEYAAVGVQLFGGKLQIGDARLGESDFAKFNYFANNFNDFPSALTTLFELLLVNNWNVIMEGTELVTSKWSRIYFISHYIIANVMMLNLVVAFVVEAYFEQADTQDSDDPTASRQVRKDRSGSFGLSSPATSSPTTPSTTSRDTTFGVVADEENLRQLLLRKRSQAAARSRGNNIYIEEVL